MFVIACLLICLLRLSGNKSKEIYERWSGGVFLIDKEGNFLSAKRSTHITWGGDPMGEQPPKEADFSISGILISGAKVETMPFVNYSIYVQGSTGIENTHTGHKYVEDQDGVKIIFNKPFVRGIHIKLTLWVITNYNWSNTGSNQLWLTYS